MTSCMRSSRAFENPPVLIVPSSSLSMSLVSTAGHSWGLRYRRVEELRDHRPQPAGAMHERHMRRAGQHGELCVREAGEIAGHTAAKQSKHLYRVLGAHDIGIPNHEQRGRLDRLD